MLRDILKPLTSKRQPHRLESWKTLNYVKSTKAIFRIRNRSSADLLTLEF